MPRKPTRDRPLRWGHGSVRERAPGTWQARWTDGTGTRRAASFPTEDAAYAHLRTVADDQRSGRYIPPDALLTATVLTRWLDRHALTVSPNTTGYYQSILKLHLIPAFGRLPLTALTSHHIQHEVDAWVRAGVARTTIQLRLRILNAALNDSVRLRLIPDNPAAPVKRPRIDRQPHTVWTAAQAAAVIAAARTVGPLWVAFYVLALTTAVRPGELRALRWADVDVAAGRLTVRRTMTRDVNRREIVGTTTKTSRARAIALPPDALTALRDWKHAQPVVGIAGYIFGGATGQPLSGGHVSAVHHRIVAAAAVPYIRPHDLRHTAATLLLEAGTHPKIVADLLGHSSVLMTLDVYSHVSDSMQRDAVNRLGDLLRERTDQAT